MSVFSKPSLPYSCYEVGHTWTPFCTNAAAGVGLSSFEEGLKIYSSLYILSSVLTGKIPTADSLKKLFISVLQSSCFLGTNGALYIVFFCLLRRMFGNFGFFSISFIPSLLANFLGILIEKPSRRPPIAVYVTNVASETMYNMLVSRGHITPMRYGKVLIFALTLSALFRWFKTTKDTSNIQYKMIKALVGEQERHIAVKTHNNPPPTPKGVFNVKHHLCPHKQGCLKYTSQALIIKFVYGWGLHASLSLVMSLSKIIRKPSKLLTLLSNSQHMKFGAFLASMAGIYRACHCALRWIRGRNSSTHSLAAGFAAGVSIGFYPNTSLMLYITWKTIETLYHQGVDVGLIPRIPGFGIIVYSLSTAFLFHASVLEPHNVKPAYWKFLMRITNNKFGEMNRHLINVMGTGSSKMNPNFYPVYDRDYLSDGFKTLLSRYSID